MVEEGSPAPDFALRSDTGETVRLSSLRGRPVVLYFYPKDHTSGCTTQACGIRDAWSEFERAGAVVLGVSPDDVASHQSFRADYELPFTLLADPDHEVAAMYDVWDAWVARGHAPPRATVQARLAKPAWKIEIVVTASIG